MKKISILLVFLLPVLLHAQNYHVNLIPDSLKENAHAVVRLDETTISIKKLNKTIIKSKTAITILNEDGDRFAYYSGYYDKFRSISDISGALFDANGIKIKSIKKKDIADVSTTDGFSLATDSRAKRFAFYIKNYPYTVEFEDEVEFEGTYSIPSWVPISSVHLAVQNSLYVVQTQNDLQFNYRQFNIDTKPQIIKDGDKTIHTWALKNYKSIVPEIYTPQWRDITPHVFFAPVQFEYADYSGSMATWKDFGNFSKQLNEGKDVLPNDIKIKVHELVDGLTNHEQKVSTLYNFLQNNTRYISVQLGIGGLQPFEASYVAKNKYGDCKALSNYMVSLLKEAGIKAYYTLVAAGDDEAKRVIEDFPRDYFNHIITCVPNGKDTIWLECTSQNNSAGYMGTFTGNRKALLIGDDGGYLVSTPKYTSKDNVQLRNVEATLTNEGTLMANVKTVFTGIQQELAHQIKNVLDEENRTKYLNRVISLPTFSVEKNEYKEIKGKIPIMEEYLNIVSPNYANISSKRLFITPNLFNRNTKLASDKPRKFDIVYNDAFKDIDTINIKVPQGYNLEAFPKKIDLQNKFGKFSIQFGFINNTIQVVRFYERNEGKYPPADYPELVKFYDEMAKADRGKIVLVKREE